MKCPFEHVYMERAQYQMTILLLLLLSLLSLLLSLYGTTDKLFALNV